MRDNERLPIGTEVWAVPARDCFEWVQASCVDVFKGTIQGYEEPEYTKIYPSVSSCPFTPGPDDQGGFTVCRKPLSVKLAYCAVSIPAARVFLTLTEATALLRAEAVQEGIQKGHEEERQRLLARLSGDDYDD